MLSRTKNENNALLNGIARAFDFSWPNAVKIDVPRRSRPITVRRALFLDQCVLKDDYERVFPEPVDVEALLRAARVRVVMVSSAESQRPKLWRQTWSPISEVDWVGSNSDTSQEEKSSTSAIEDCLRNRALV